METLIVYLWQALPQVSFFLVTNMCLLRQNMSFVTTKLMYYAFFVMTNIFLSWQNFWCSKYLSQQTSFCCDKFCCDKLTFVVTNTCLTWQNMFFVVTKLCLWQNFCCDKHMFVATNICDKCATNMRQIFVATKVLSRWALVACNSEWLYFTQCFEYPLEWLQRCCYVAGAAKWNCCHLGTSCVFIIQPCQLQWQFIWSCMPRMHVCLAVTYHLHFWQSHKMVSRNQNFWRGREMRQGIGTTLSAQQSDT